MITGFQAGVMGTYGVLWTPANITTALWLDAYDSSTITLVDSKVSQWNDKSGNSRHFFQSNSIYRPSHSNNAVVFTGANNHRLISSWTTRYTTMSVFAVCKPTAISGTSFQAIFSHVTYYAVDKQDFPMKLSLNSLATSVDLTLSTGDDYNADLTIDANDSFADKTSIFSFDYAASGTSSIRLYVNGTERGSANGILVSNTDYPYSVGNTALDHLVTGKCAFNGSMFEIMVFTSAISVSERQKVEGYVSHKWGLTASLPSDHPYKYAAPTV